LDTSIPSTADLSGDQAVISRAQALQAAVQAASNETEDGRRIAPALIDRLHEAQLFRLLLPQILERDRDRSRHLLPCDRDDRQSGDASTAWCLSQAGACAMTAAYLAPPVAHEIFGHDPRARAGLGAGTQGQGDRV